MITGKRVAAPATLIQKYPELRKFADPDERRRSRRPAGSSHCWPRLVVSAGWEGHDFSRPGAGPTFHAEFPIWGCPTLPALFAGGWAFCTDYDFHECTSNQSAIKTSAGSWPSFSRGIPNLGLPHPSRALCGRVGLLHGLHFPRMHVKPVRYQDQRWGLAQPFTRSSQFGGCPTLPALCAGGWAFCTDYDFHECTSNQSAIKTSAGSWPNFHAEFPIGVAPPFPRFLREGGPSARTTISTNARQTSPLSRPGLPALHHV